MALLIRADFGLHDVLLAGKLDGWSPRFITGYEHFLYYGPGFSWLTGAVQLATAGLLSLTGALKVVAIGSFVAIGPAAAFLARSFGLSRRAAGVAAVLAVAVNSPFGVGLAGVFTIALLPHQVAATGFCIALGCGLRTVTDPRRRWVVLMGVALAAVVVTHLITTLVLVLFLVISLPTIFVTDRPALPAALRRLLAAGALGAGLAAFWLVPYLAHFGDRGVVPAWATPPIGSRLADIFAGRILFGSSLAVLVAAAFAFAGYRVIALKRWAFALFIAPMAFLTITHTLASQAPGLDISPQLANRGLGYAGLLALLPLAAAIAFAVRWIPNGTMATAAALAAAAVIVVGVAPPSRAPAREMPDPAPAMVEAAATLRKHVPPGARFATERDYPAEIARAGMTHPDFWLAWHAQRNTLNTFGLELSPSPSAGGEAERVGRVAADRSADALARLGTTHLVTVNPATAPALEASGRFRRVWERDFMAIFAVVPAQGQPAVSSLASVPAGASATARLRGGGEHLVVDLTTVEAVPVTVATGWSPKWRATIDGKPVPLRATPDGLLRVDVPAGSHRLALDFHQDRWPATGGAVSVLTALALFAYCGRRMARLRPGRR